MTETASGDLIELRVDNIAQLFHTLDPFPFRERDLDKEAEEFIVGWARELGRRPYDKNHGSLSRNRGANQGGTRVEGGLPSIFFRSRRALLNARSRSCFGSVAASLGIGVTILIVCLLSAHLVGGYLIDTPFSRLVEESFLILGWVANWRPLEIFLYDWLPLARRRDLYRRLAAATVELKSYTAPKPSEP